ncbi:MAG TPA: saccharopine dehydrogenase NADP-binding domain-containing protein [Candidatus Obscuribacterales bacterium]
MITLVAATGYTGSLIARELAALKASFRLAARNQAKLDELADSLGGKCEKAIIDVTDRSTIAAAISGSRVVLNCAGPFTDFGEPVVQEALSAGAHYLDTTGEQHFIKTMFDKYGDAFRSSGSALVPASAFEYAVGDAASAMLDPSATEAFDEITVVYSVHGMYTSKGTKKSVMRVLSLPPYLLDGGQLKLIAPGGSPAKIDIPGEGPVNALMFPGGEILFLPLHMKVQNVKTMLASPLPGPALSLMTYLAPAIVKSPLSKLLISGIEGGGEGPPEELRQKTSFTVLATGITKGGRLSTVVKGKDPYLVTAQIAAALAQCLDTSRKFPKGAASPSMIAGFEKIVEATAGSATWTRQ